MSFGMILWFVLVTILCLSLNVVECDDLSVSDYIAHISIRLTVFSVFFLLFNFIYMSNEGNKTDLDIELGILTKEYETYSPTEESKYRLKETTDGVEVIYEYADGTTSKDKVVGVKKEKIQAQIKLVEKELKGIFYKELLNRYLIFVSFNLVILLIEFLFYLKIVYLPKNLADSKRALRN